MQEITGKELEAGEMERKSNRRLGGGDGIEQEVSRLEGRKCGGVLPGGALPLTAATNQVI